MTKKNKWEVSDSRPGLLQVNPGLPLGEVELRNEICWKAWGSVA